jgi:hypothetical protein
VRGREAINKLAVWLLVVTIAGGRQLSVHADQGLESATGFAVSSVQLSPMGPGTPDTGPTGGPAQTPEAQPDASTWWVSPWNTSDDANSAPPGDQGPDGLRDVGQGDDEQYLGYASAGAGAPSSAPHRVTLLNDIIWGGGGALGTAPAPFQAAADARGLGSVFTPHGGLMETLAHKTNGSVFQNLLAYTGLPHAPPGPLHVVHSGGNGGLRDKHDCLFIACDDLSALLWILTSFPGRM